MKNPIIRVERFAFHKDCTISRVFVRGKLFCFSIEDAKRDVKIKGETCIPDGVYELGTRFFPRFSPRLGHDMLWVKNVPEFEFILIHTGNTKKDTEGCLIVGSKIGVLNGLDAVLDSKTAYQNLYKSVIDNVKKGGELIEYVSI